ncbi:MULTISPECIES: complex I NDUFA9 subunit family protein [Dyella]|uniref:Complex I NDUFA9 subunit family protein n=2 Tax=Dyella TaxID=231454 RepID=A0A4R0YD26_9GAMM|nr:MULTISPECIES: complex I NDUFA9 subunit family protein [Dyella]TBR36249.1 complex I NDUFA9 subunit family protein [Dyella terrae]TCI05906.1 complex I NDUFA9 subunit family protein [Dyella soli]
MKPKKLVVLGGTGFLGRYLIPRLAQDGHRMTLLSRNREKRRAFAVIPGVDVRSIDVYDGNALRHALAGADAAIMLIGILNPQGRYSFQETHVELPRRLAAACHAANVPRLHLMSALKAGQGLSQYLKTRGEAESAVRHSGLDWTIYQSSVMFGAEDGLVSRFAGLMRRMPVLPLARSASRMAPTFAGDVAEAIARCVKHDAQSLDRTFELFGPEVLTLGEIVRKIRDEAGLRTPIIDLPDGLGRLQARFAEFLPGKPFSRDNFLSLRTDSVGKHNGYATLGITPQALTPWLPTLLHGSPRQRRLDAARNGYRSATGEKR